MSGVEHSAGARDSSRRRFLRQLVAGAAAAVFVPEWARSQAQAPQTMQTHDSMSMDRSASNLFAMDQSAARTVTRPPKPGASPSMNNDARDELEHHLRCQCGCTLDVYTCRTTDFSCRVSPSMHRDVMALVKGGYGAQEIIDAFVDSYGERVLMAPKKSGFNLLAWFTPGIAVIVGGGLVYGLIRRWGKSAASIAPSAAPMGVERPRGVPIDATADELARLEAAVKGDDS